MSTKTITIFGGFHQVEEITVRGKVNTDGSLKLSPRQYLRIQNHMCGHSGCPCNIDHGWEVEGVGLGELFEALTEALRVGLKLPKIEPTPQQIQSTRKLARLSQEQAAALISYSRRAWQEWEKGTYKMHPALWGEFQRKLAS